MQEGVPIMRREAGLLLAAIKIAACAHADELPEILDATFRESPACLTVIASDMSPAVLLHVPGGNLRLFATLDRWGLRPPQHFALRGEAGVVQVASPGMAQGAQFAASWIICWSGQAPGPLEFEVPWLVVLQRRPSQVVLDGEGLSLSWSSSGDWVVLMPLYGYLKLPRQPPGYLAEHGLPQPDLRPWEWAQGLPEHVIRRCDWWASTIREYPLTVDETFSVDPGADTVTFRHRYTWLRTDDDWDTAHRKFATLPPVLGLAYQGGSFPLTITPTPVDADLFTPYGPLIGTVDTDENAVTMRVLQYIHDCTMLPTADQLPQDGPARFCAEQIAARMKAKFRTGSIHDIWDHGGAENYCWQVMGDRYYCRALPLCDPQTRNLATRTLREYFANFVLQEGQYTEFRGKLLLKGPGIGTWGGYDDAGKFSSNLLETLWEYAHYTGDWALIRDRWPLILRLFVTPRECDWKGCGRGSIAELGDEAAPPLCLARMAWQVGDMDTYAYACSIFARELLHHYVKCRRECVQYFRLRQPWHSFEFMPEEVYLTNLWGETAGWQIDGPTYPQHTGERQYNNRWVRFSNEDVARFHRDVLGPEMQAEMDLLRDRADCPYRPGQAEAHIAPSLEQLRSMLLWERPQDLARLTSPEQARLGRTADAISFYLAFVRTAKPPHHERLIPAVGMPTQFAMGLQREEPGTGGSLVLCLSTDTRTAGETTWPTVSWWGWRSPKQPDSLPFADRLSFGQITVADRPPPAQVSHRLLSWTTRVIRIQ